MNLDELQHRRNTTIQAELELAVAHIANARREAWLELEEDDPLRDEQLDEALDGVLDVLQHQLAKTHSVRVGNLRTIARTR